MPFSRLAKLAKKAKVIYVPVEHPMKKSDIEKIVLNNIMNRRSNRNYVRREVDDKHLLKILEAASYAPSAGNYQPWEFIIVRDPKIRSQLAEACYNQDWMTAAPVMIVVCTNCKIAGAMYAERGMKLYGLQATAAAIENMLLAAEALGLSTCWVGSFAETIVSRVLECPDYARPCAIITVGYSDIIPRTIPRQGLEDFVHNGKFGNSIKATQVRREKKPTYMKFR